MVLDFSALDSDPGKLNDLKAPDSGFYTTCCTCNSHYSVKFVEGAAKPPCSSGVNKIYEVSIDGVSSGSDLVNRILSAVGSNPKGHYTNLEADGSRLKVYDHRAQYDPNGAHIDPGTDYGLAGTGVAYAVDEKDIVPDITIQAGSEPDQTIPIQLPRINCSAIGISGANVLNELDARASITIFNRGKDYVSRERSKAMLAQANQNRQGILALLQ